MRKRKISKCQTMWSTDKMSEKSQYFSLSLSRLLTTLFDILWFFFPRITDLRTRKLFISFFFAENGWMYYLLCICVLNWIPVLIIVVKWVCNCVYVLNSLWICTTTTHVQLDIADYVIFMSENTIRSFVIVVISHKNICSHGNSVTVWRSCELVHFIRFYLMGNSKLNEIWSHNKKWCNILLFFQRSLYLYAMNSRRNEKKVHKFINLQHSAIG